MLNRSSRILINSVVLCITGPTLVKAQRTLHDSAAFLVRQAGDIAAYTTSEQQREAIAWLLEATQLYAHTHDAVLAASARVAAGSRYRALGFADSAIIYQRAAISELRPLSDRLALAAALNSLGESFQSQSYSDSALACFREALTIRRAQADKRGISETLLDIGLMHWSSGRLDSAFVGVHEALVIRQQIADSVGQVEAMINMGGVFRDLGFRDSAAALYRHAGEILKTHPNPPSQLQLLRSLGELHLVLGNRDSANHYLLQALESSREQQNRLEQAGILTALGANNVSVNPDSALALLNAAAKLAHEIGERSGEATALASLGSVHQRLGRPDSALHYLALARETQERIGSRSAELYTLVNIAGVHWTLGRPDSALIYVQTALAIAREVGDKRGLAGTLASTGVLHWALQRPDSAIAYLRPAIAATREIGDRDTEAVALNNLAAAFVGLSEGDSAVKYMRQSLKLSRETKSRVDEANVLANLGNVFSRTGAMDSAATYYYAGLALTRELGLAERESKILLSLAELNHRQLSRPRLEQAVAYYDSMVTVNARIMAHAGQDASVISFAERSDAQDAFSLWTLAWLARAPEIGRRRAAYAAFAATERGRAQGLILLMRRFSGKEFQSSLSILRGNSSYASLDREGAELVRSVLGRHGAALSYLVTSDTVITWLLWDGSIEVFRRPISLDSLSQSVYQLRASTEIGEATASLIASRGVVSLEATDKRIQARLGGSRASRAAGRKLRELLIPPEFTKRVPRGSEVLVVPNGPLSLLPFALLPIDSGTDFGARYALRFAPSFAALSGVETARESDSTRQHQIKRESLVVGNPAMPRVMTARGDTVSLPALPGADSEGNWVARRLGTSVLTGSAATETAVRSRLPKAHIVHFATHAFAYASDAGARSSFVAFSPGAGNDGLLTVGEILDDSTLTLRAELVVLSACQTGLGDLKHAEGVVGFQRAFLARGARSVLVSLWSVDDRATRALMQQFYSHWLDDLDRPRKAEALRRAQMDLRATRRFRHPSNWAGFQIVGAS